MLENMDLSGQLRKDQFKYRVVIIQRILPHYRVAFFERLNNLLSDINISLTVIYSNERKNTVPKTVDIDMSWALKVKNKYIKVLNSYFYYMSIPKDKLICDLLIVEHAMSFLNLYMFLTSSHSYKLAMWGHGENFQSNKSNYLKDKILLAADWWFGYTDLTKNILVKKGYDESKVCTVNNAIDSEIFNIHNHNFLAEEENVRTRLGIIGDNICVYCGGIYSHKKIDFLLEVAEQLATRIEDFYLIIIGDGPEQWKVEEAARKNSRIKYIGPLFGKDRVVYLELSKAMLMPGLVGLAIIDSFASRSPIFTTDIDIHSPEIAYLDNGVNGVMTRHSVEEYATKLEEYLLSKDMQENLQKGCEESAQKYTVVTMAENFKQGITNCLSSQV